MQKKTDSRRGLNDRSGPAEPADAAAVPLGFSPVLGVQVDGHILHIYIYIVRERERLLVGLPPPGCRLGLNAASSEL